MGRSATKPGFISGLLAVGFIVVLSTAVILLNRRSDHQQNKTDGHPAEHETGRSYSVTIREPMGAPRMDTGLKDFHGNPVSVACSTCHTSRKPDFENRVQADLNEFHQQVSVNHGKLSCLACHNAKDYDSLHLADGHRVDFGDVMQLCAQCHGPQMTAFKHGAHGGMSGFWDLSRGPQTKNNCIDCHNPHSPQFPSMKPTFKPRDRFLESPGEEH